MHLYNSDCDLRHLDVCNEQPFQSQNTCVLRMSLSSDTLHFFWSFLSRNPSSACMFSPIHSARLVGSQWQVLEHRVPVVLPIRLLQRRPAIHGQQALSRRLILSGATADTASEALHPGKWRLFRLANQPGKPTYQEKSKYERYWQSITMVYSWDILTDKRRDSDVFSRQYITLYEGYRIPGSQATLKFRSCNKEHSCS